MNRSVIIFLLLLLGFIVGIKNADAEEYRLGPGDVLGIEVFGYQELKDKQVIVRPDGKITFPFVGVVGVAGKTLNEATEIITAGLSRYLVDPRVTINVIHFRTTRVYVLGEVQKPGMYEIDRQHRLLDAVGMAGGYTKDSAKKKVIIIRQDRANQPQVVNMLDLLRKGDLSQNCVLNEGDVVYLNDNGRIDFVRDILPWISGGYMINQWNE